jgi:hypothetical protein
VSFTAVLLALASLAAVAHGCEIKVRETPSLDKSNTNSNRICDEMKKRKGEKKKKKKKKRFSLLTLHPTPTRSAITRKACSGVAHP